jgi:hypothetical protein
MDMESMGLWAVLPPDLLRFISDGFGLPLESYSSIRGVCTAWRSALPAAAPLLLTVSGFDALRHRQIEPGQVVSASFLAAGRSFRLSELPTGGEFCSCSLWGQADRMHETRLEEQYKGARDLQWGTVDLTFCCHCPSWLHRAL